MPVVLELVGFALITFGVWRCDSTAGIIVAGVFVLILGVLTDGVSLPRRKRKPE